MITTDLPLKSDKIKSIAIIGENSTNLHSGGGGSSQIKALYEISPLMGIKMRLRWKYRYNIF